jgi:hypothetical protein
MSVGKCWVLGAGCWVLGALCWVLGASAVVAQTGMPDPSQMSGVPLPSPELPAGTLTVRVVRGTLSKNIPNQKVELVTADARREAATDASGRAAFQGLRPGEKLRVFTVVDGRRFESQVITMPAGTGVRVMLVATDPSAAARGQDDAAVRSVPPQRGVVVFGGESRFIVERGDEALNVFYVLEIVNSAGSPVETDTPLIFDLPSGARGVTLLEGSTPQATVGGSRVTVTGPFAPGTTPLQIGYELPYRGAEATVEQRLPAALPRLAVAGETTGGVTVASTQFATTRDMNSDGRTFLVGNGPGLPAGGVLRVSFDGLPHHPRWPQLMALALAVIVMTAGLVLGFRRPSAAPQSQRERLVASRAARFAELESLEARRRAGTVSAEQYADERRRLIAALEDIYTALDEHHV